MTRELDARIKELRARRNDTIRKTEAELAEMQAELERQMMALRKEVAAEANRIGGVMQVTSRKIVAAKKRQAKLEADLAVFGEESPLLLRGHKRLGLRMLLGSVLLGNTFISPPGALGTTVLAS